MSHDGTMVAAYSSDRSVIVWDVGSGRQVERIEVDSGNLWGLTFGATTRCSTPPAPSGS